MKAEQPQVETLQELQRFATEFTLFLARAIRDTPGSPSERGETLEAIEEELQKFSSLARN